MYYFANLHEAESALEPYFPSKLKRLAYTTEHIERFLEYVGNPQDKQKSIHIAGTSGKTSTSYYVASLLQQSGKKAGLLTSPHIEQLNERVQINLEPLPERQFCDELAVFMQVVKQSGITLSYTELLYGFAFWEFARQQVEYIVVEVGLGGLLDATNVINRADKTCIITDIGKDHVHVLGNSLAEIAEHKAGIIRLHNRVFCYEQDSEIMDQIRSRCQKYQADITTITTCESPVDYSFLPAFQQRNFCLALTATEALLDREHQEQLSSEQIIGAAHVHIPGRMEILKQHGRHIVFDAAHNAQKLHALQESMRISFPGQKAGVLFALSGSRNPKELVAELQPIANHVVITSLTMSHTKQVDPQAILAACHDAGISAEVVLDHEDACQVLLDRNDPIILVTGSLYLLSQVRDNITDSVVRP